MEILFLGQGFADISDESVGQTIIDSLENEVFNQFTAIVAFASEDGVERVINQIKNENNHFKQVEFYIGIDNQVTSYEALNLLLKSELDCYIYHTVSHIIFHPKIYIFEGKEYGKIIIGSSNLTDKGLSKNMEASLVVDFKMNDEQGLLDQIEKHYRLLLDKTSPNVQELTQKLIKQLLDAELIPKEKERRKTSETASKSPRNQALLSKIKALFPPVEIPKNTSKSAKRKKPKTDVKKVTNARPWQDTDPKADDYRHPDIGDTDKDVNTKLPCQVGDVVEYVCSKGKYKDQKMVGIVTKCFIKNIKNPSRSYEDGHPRYHYKVDILITDDKGNETVINKMVKVEKVKRHGAKGDLAKQICKSQEEFAARKARQKVNSK